MSDTPGTETEIANSSKFIRDNAKDISRVVSHHMKEQGQGVLFINTDDFESRLEDCSLYVSKHHLGGIKDQVPYEDLMYRLSTGVCPVCMKSGASVSVYDFSTF